MQQQVSLIRLWVAYRPEWKWDLNSPLALSTLRGHLVITSN